MEIKAGSEAASFVLQAAADGRQNDLMEVDVDDVALSQYRCLSGCSALHWAAGHNQLATVRYLVVERNMDVNIRATKKAKDRTPLHYACRNGWLATARLLVELGAAVDAKAKYGVSPFQLAVWQNHLHICRYLVEEKGVDPAELNDFDCGAVHWIGLCPPKAADGPLGQGELLLPMVKWLQTLKGIDFTIRTTTRSFTFP
jgi:ankyrin repeat protein